MINMKQSLGGVGKLTFGRKNEYTKIKRKDGKVANIDSVKKLWDYLNGEEDIWETK